MSQNPPDLATIRDFLLLLPVCSLLASVSCRHAVAPAGTLLPATTPDSAGPITPAHTDGMPIAVDGRTRTLIVHVPAGPPVPRAVVFNLHGSGGTAAAQEAFTAMDALADSAGFIVVYPEGAIALGGGFAWNVPGQPLLGGEPVPADSADDVAFFRQALAAIGQAYAIDARRVFITGMSGGARMASQLGCDLSTLVAAVAPVAGLRFPAPCNSERPVPVIAFHGTADTTNPYDGSGQGYWTYSVPSAAQQWAAHDACGTTPTVSEVSSTVTLTAYGDCAGTSTVALYTIAGAGHEWPGAPQQTPAIDASAVMWGFFAAHPLP